MFSLIKVTSIIVVTVAIALDLVDFYLSSQQATLASNLNFWLWVGNIILFAHAIEVAIAVPKARFQGKNPIFYGIYTFFVGFVGLKELFQQDSSKTTVGE